MSISATHLLTEFSITPATSFATASISPSANKLILAAVVSNAATENVVPTLTGCGLTWVQVATSWATPQLRQATVFRARGTPTAGALTFDFAGVTQVTCGWSISEFGGANPSGTNGSGAIVQSNFGTITGTNTGLSISLTGALTRNATYGAVRHSSTDAIVVGSGYTELGNASGTGGRVQSQWRSDGATPVDWTWASSTSPGNGVAVEILAAVMQLAALGVG